MYQSGRNHTWSQIIWPSCRLFQVFVERRHFTLDNASNSHECPDSLPSWWDLPDDPASPIFGSMLLRSCKTVRISPRTGVICQHMSAFRNLSGQIPLLIIYITRGRIERKVMVLNECENATIEGGSIETEQVDRCALVLWLTISIFKANSPKTGLKYELQHAIYVFTWNQFGSLCVLGFFFN